MRDLARLLRPRSIAVLGGAWAVNVIDQCARFGFDGAVWPVHPTRATVGGVQAFPSLADLPSAPDATFIGVNRAATIDVVADLAAMGAGGGICFASGWQEAGEADLQARLVTAAGRMPILGPNCYGVINYLDGALLWPDQHGGRRVVRGVALISQSSNIAINLTMQARALPVAYVACLGNAAVVGLAELGAALLADDRVTALGLYVEGFDDAAAFAALAEVARAAGKGIVCIKAGKTALGRSAAASHTAALAGGGSASSAYLARIGVAEVASPAELVETLKILHLHSPKQRPGAGPGQDRARDEAAGTAQARGAAQGAAQGAARGAARGAALGQRICSLSCSGGEAGLVADLAAPFGIDFPPPAPAQVARLGAILGPVVTIANPLDYHTFIWGDLDRTTDVFTTMLAGYDAGIGIIDPPRADRCDPAGYQPALDALVAAARATGVPTFPVCSLPENFDEATAIRLMDDGIATLMGLETALAALRAAQTPAGEPGWRPFPPSPARKVTLLPEGAAKALLAGAGINVPRGVTAPDLPSLRAALGALQPPFALKGLGFAHKTEAGAVRLGVATLDHQAPMPGAAGYLAEEMVQGGLAEVLVGLRRDPVYGSTLTLGMGGVTAELLADTVTLILPVTAPEVLAALHRLRLWPLLDGYRGRPRADTGALVDLAMRLAGLMQDDTTLEEIEINPVILCSHGAVAVDALIGKAMP